MENLIEKYKDELQKANELANVIDKINECKLYLDNTDHKFNVDYEPKEGEDLEVIKAKRSEARKFIRANDVGLD